MPARTNTPPPSLALLSEIVPRIFEQVQTSVANHQKNYVALNKIHSEAAAVTKQTDNGENIHLIGEKAFEDIFINLLLRVLPIKKGANVVDRVVKFVAGYVKFVNDKTAKDRVENNDLDIDEETPATRFIERLVKYLLKGFESKDKNVRFRVIQLTAEVVPSAEFIGDSLFNDLHEALIDRVHDKEAQVRAQAVVAISRCTKLEKNEMYHDDDLEVLLDSLIRDPSVEVRKAALLNTPITADTLEPLLSRIRDPDASIRKVVYDVMLSDRLQDVTQLSVIQREAVVRCGLRDRDSSVRAAASKLLGEWFDRVEGSAGRFVELFNYDGIDAPDSFSDPDLAFAPAEKALLSIFEDRKEVLDSLNFSAEYWDNLNTTQAFIARVFVQHCLNENDEARIEQRMPVLTAFGFKIQELFEDLMSKVQIEQERQLFEDVEDHKNLDSIVYVLQELLKLCVNLDSGDEIGRRKLFALVKDMTSQAILPERLLPYCLDILRKFSSSERDLIRVVVEVIHDLRDTDKEDEEGQGEDSEETNDVEATPMPTRRLPKRLQDMNPDEREKSIAMDLRCLSLCIGMLERVNSTFEENSTLEGILGELIIPAVRGDELELKEKGFICLGLCCLLTRQMAFASFQSFMSNIQDTPESFRIRVLQILFDIIMVHEGDMLGNPTVGGDKVVDYLRKMFLGDESKHAQAVICTGLCKLMLSGMITDETVLESLVLAYMSPKFADNQQVLQCLSYFFSAYCFTSSDNQRRVQKNFMHLFSTVTGHLKEADDDDKVVAPLQVACVLVDWTDPQKVMEHRHDDVDKYVHYDLAIEIVKALFGKELSKEEKKIFCQILAKLYIPPDIDTDKIRTLKLLVNNISLRRPIRDTTSRNAFTKFDTFLTKTFVTQLENFNEEEFRQLEDLKDLFEFLDDIIPDESEEEIELPKRGGRKRRSESIATTVTEISMDEDMQDSRPNSKSKGKGSAVKRRRISGMSDETGVGDDEIRPEKPTRSMPRRAATKAVGIIAQVPGEASDSELMPPPSTRPKKRALGARRTAEERLEADLSELLSNESESDCSIMDGSDGEPTHVEEGGNDEEGEVDDLL